MNAGAAPMWPVALAAAASPTAWYGTATGRLIIWRGFYEGFKFTQAGKGHETEARGYDPTLKAALRILTASGVAYRMTAYLPSEVRSLINTGGVSIPGTGNKLPFPKRRP